MAWRIRTVAIYQRLLLFYLFSGHGRCFVSSSVFCLMNEIVFLMSGGFLLLVKTANPISRFIKYAVNFFETKKKLTNNISIIFYFNIYYSIQKSLQTKVHILFVRNL